MPWIGSHWQQLRFVACPGHALEDISDFSVLIRGSAKVKNCLKAQECLHLCKTEHSAGARGSPYGVLGGVVWGAASKGSTNGSRALCTKRALHSGSTQKSKGTKKTSNMSCSGEA